MLSSERAHASTDNDEPECVATMSIAWREDIIEFLNINAACSQAM
jgi:hypothetical protein